MSSRGRSRTCNHPITCLRRSCRRASYACPALHSSPDLTMMPRLRLVDTPKITHSLGGETVMPWHVAITEYATSLRAARRSPGTVRLHVHYLHRLAGATASPWGVTTADQCGTSSARRRSAETRKSARSAYVGFYRWATAEGMIDPDPAVRLAAISVPPGKPRPAPERVLAKALMVA